MKPTAFRRRTALLDAGFRLRRGEILGVAGLIGAGRTELVRALFGLDAVRSGRIRLGVFEGPAAPAERLAQGMGMLSEDRKGEGLAINLSVAENLTLTRLDPYVHRGWLDRAARDRAAGDWMTRLGVKAAGPDVAVGSLSGGNQQKVQLARLLHHDCDVLLLDEPTRGIDVASKATIYKWIGRLAAGGKAVLFVSSYLPELLGVCDTLAVMRRGRLGPVRPIEQWNEHSVMAAATGAESASTQDAAANVSLSVRTLVCLAGALLAAAALPAQDLGAVVQGMELHYNRLATLQTDFEQTLEYAGQVRAVERGTLYLYRPQKMRWDYTKPKGKVLVGDGERLRMYSPTTHQVRTVLLGDSADMRAPLAFLLGRLNLRRQFRNLALSTIDGKPALVGEGRTGQENYRRVEFFYNPDADYRLDRVRVFGRDDSITTFTFERENVNIRLDEKMFVFEAPPGAEILPEQSAED